MSSKPAYQNFKMIGKEYFKERLEVPVLTASTLLVPGYLDAEKAEKIARFIAQKQHQISPLFPILPAEKVICRGGL